jgi:hypothetical protein
MYLQIGLSNYRNHILFRSRTEGIVHKIRTFLIILKYLNILFPSPCYEQDILLRKSGNICQYVFFMYVFKMVFLCHLSVAGAVNVAFKLYKL